MGDRFRIRSARRDDLGAVVAVERASFRVPWHGEDFSFGSGRSLLVASVEEMVTGFALGRVAADEGEVLNIAVHPEHRGVGIGTALLAALVTKMRHEGAIAVYLDVRESNRAAITIYERFGFEIVGSRTRYYSKPTENALEMKLV